MRILLDTCVLSEIRHPSGNPSVKDAVAVIPDENLFLSVITLGEIAKGTALLPPGKRKNNLLSWLNGLQIEFSDRILPIEADTARLWGNLTARVQQAGVPIPAIDGLIAAWALHYGMHLMTRNTRHFEAAGVLIIDPWQKPPLGLTI